MLWYLVYVTEGDDERYEMMSERTVEENFYDKGDYHQHREHRNTTMQILGQSRNFIRIAQKLKEKRNA